MATTPAPSPRPALAEITPDSRNSRLHPEVSNSLERPTKYVSTPTVGDLENVDISRRPSQATEETTPAPAFSSSTLCIPHPESAVMVAGTGTSSEFPTPVQPPNPEPSSTLNPAKTRPPERGMSVTFLFLNGHRHQVILDAQCFEQNNILSRDRSDPLTTSIMALKELLWRTWNTEWGDRPHFPGAMRLIHLGRLLEEHMALKDYRMTCTDPNIIHVAVPPAEMVDDISSPNATKAHLRARFGRNGDVPEARCRCLIL